MRGEGLQETPTLQVSGRMMRLDESASGSRATTPAGIPAASYHAPTIG